jgi:hypothetical protein
MRIGTMKLDYKATLSYWDCGRPRSQLNAGGKLSVMSFQFALLTCSGQGRPRSQ